MSLLNNWNTEDVNKLHNEILTEWSFEERNIYFEQEYELNKHESVEIIKEQNADFSEESFNDLLFLLKSWETNKDNKDINALSFIEMIKEELKERAFKNKWLKLRLPLNILL